MKKLNINSDACTREGQKQKERHIVSWSAEEDDILREQIRVHGTENWAIIASNFKDKSTRQCRRRWYTYLNSDFKRGGWSPEEDMLLCEAQKIFGNRWTEIAKVVSGRTDNAVKNRFTTLSKKRAKYEALAKENNMSSFINLNNKRVIFPNGQSTAEESESVPPLKKMSIYISNTRETQQEKVAGGCGTADNLLRPPFSVLAPGPSGEAKIARQLQEKPTDHTITENGNSQGTFLKKDDPKVLALMQQAELLRSLAIKVNSEQTDQSLETAWMALQDYLKQNKDCHLSAFPDHDDQLVMFEELVEDLRSCNAGSKTDTYGSSPATSDYSTGSTLPSNVPGDKTGEFLVDITAMNQDNGHEMESKLLDNHDFLTEGGGDLCQSKSPIQVNMLSCCDTNHNDGAAIECDNTVYDSPIHVTQFFRALAATIPSPKFSESEKNFLMKTLGMDSSSPSRMTNSSHPPACKRSLLHCL